MERRNAWTPAALVGVLLTALLAVGWGHLDRLDQRVYELGKAAVTQKQLDNLEERLVERLRDACFGRSGVDSPRLKAESRGVPK